MMFERWKELLQEFRESPREFIKFQLCKSHYLAPLIERRAHRHLFLMLLTAWILSTVFLFFTFSSWLIATLSGVFTYLAWSAAFKQYYEFPKFTFKGKFFTNLAGIVLGFGVGWILQYSPSLGGFYLWLIFGYILVRWVWGMYYTREQVYRDMTLSGWVSTLNHRFGRGDVNYTSADIVTKKLLNKNASHPILKVKHRGFDPVWHYREVEPPLDTTHYVAWFRQAMKTSVRDQLSSCAWLLPDTVYLDNQSAMTKVLVNSEINEKTGKEWDLHFDWRNGFLEGYEATLLPGFKDEASYLDVEWLNNAPNTSACIIGNTKDNPNTIYDPRVDYNIAIFGEAGFGKSRAMVDIAFQQAIRNVLMDRRIWNVHIIDPEKLAADFLPLKWIPGIEFITDYNSVYEFLEWKSSDVIPTRQKRIVELKNEHDMSQKDAEEVLYTEQGLDMTYFDEFTSFLFSGNDTRTKKRLEQAGTHVARSLARGRACGDFWCMASQEISEKTFKQWMRTNLRTRLTGTIATTGGSYSAIGTSEAFYLGDAPAGRGYYGRVGTAQPIQVKYFDDDMIIDIRKQLESRGLVKSSSEPVRTHQSHETRFYEAQEQSENSVKYETPQITKKKVNLDALNNLYGIKGNNNDN